MKRNYIRFSFLFIFSIHSIPIFALKQQVVKTLYLKDYIVHIKNSAVITVDKHNLETHSFEISTLPTDKNVFGKENIIYWKESNKTKSICVRSFVFRQEKMDYIILVSLFLCVLVLLVIYFFYKKQSKKGDLSLKSVEKHSYFERIVTYQGRSLRTHELDELFDIQKLSYDSRKLKRHRLIQEINKKHPSLIQRVKDKEDQRKYLYLINKN